MCAKYVRPPTPASSNDDMRDLLCTGSSLLPLRVGSVYYLCCQCGHNNIHSLATGTHKLLQHGELDSTQCLWGEPDPWDGRTRRQKRRRRRTITTDHDYESLSTSLSSSGRPPLPCKNSPERKQREIPGLVWEHISSLD